MTTTAIKQFNPHSERHLMIVLLWAVISCSVQKLSEMTGHSTVVGTRQHTDRCYWYCFIRGLRSFARMKINQQSITNQKSGWSMKHRQHKIIKFNLMNNSNILITQAPNTVMSLHCLSVCLTDSLSPTGKFDGGSELGLQALHMPARQ